MRSAPTQPAKIIHLQVADLQVDGKDACRQTVSDYSADEAPAPFSVTSIYRHEISILKVSSECFSSKSALREVG